jgi:hypothetical protein
VYGTRSRVLRAGEGKRGRRRDTTSGLPLLPLVVTGAGAGPIASVGVGVRHGRWQGTVLRTA